MGFSAKDFDKLFEYCGKDFMEANFKEYEYTPKCTLGDTVFDIAIKINEEKYAKAFDRKPKGLSEEEKDKFEEERKPIKAELEKFAKTTAEKFSSFRVNIYTYCLEKMLKEVKENKKPGQLSVHLNSKNILHMIPYKDRVTLIYGVDFLQSTDQSLAKVFLQEIKAAKTHLKNILAMNTYVENDEIPKDVIAIDVPKNYSNGLLVIECFAKDFDKMKKYLNYLVTLREYMQFHIHSIKTFLHIRMNKKGREFADKLTNCLIIPETYLKHLETLEFYSGWNKKKEDEKVFSTTVKRINA